MRKSLATPQQGNGRRSMLGFGSAASKQKGIPEQKKLNFSANRSRLQNSTVGSKRFVVYNLYIIIFTYQNINSFSTVLIIRT